MKTTNQTDKATKLAQLSPEQEAAWEAIQDRMTDLTDKYIALKSEHAALVAVAEAAIALQKKSEEGLWGAWADNTEAGKILKASREALANLAKIRGGAK